MGASTGHYSGYNTINDVQIDEGPQGLIGDITDLGLSFKSTLHVIDDWDLCRRHMLLYLALRL